MEESHLERTLHYFKNYLNFIKHVPYESDSYGTITRTYYIGYLETIYKTLKNFFNKVTTDNEYKKFNVKEWRFLPVTADLIVSQIEFGKHFVKDLSDNYKNEYSILSENIIKEISSHPYLYNNLEKF